MKVMYSRECTGYDFALTMEMLQNTDKGVVELPEFAEKLCRTVEENIEEIEQALREVLEHWKLDRVAPVERALLKLGCSEISFFADIPPKVTINEYIELAKIYADDNAPAFINGVLDKLVKLKGKADFKVGKRAG